MLMIAFVFGFLLGAVAVVAAEALALLLILDSLRRRGEAAAAAAPEPRGLDPDQSLAALFSKKGFVWVLEGEKVPKLSFSESPTRGIKESKSKKEIVEVSPVKKYAKIKEHFLILFDLDGAEARIDLRDCTIVAVSASDLSSRKWAKRYPIKLESKDPVFYNGSKTCYLYVENSWEKESWCKALRLTSCSNKEKLDWFGQLNDQFHQYLTSLNSEYRSFLKPSTLLGEALDRTSKMDGSSSRVRLFLKKLAKKTSKSGVDYKSSSLSSSNRGERKIGEKLRSLHDASLISGLVKTNSADKSSSNSLQDLVQPTSQSHLGNRSQLPILPDVVGDDKLVNDDGTLCWNLLFSRLFFDAKRNTEINNSIKARIQRTLSNMRTPSYVGGVTLNGLDLGNLPPYIHNMRVLPMDLNEAWTVEVDIEYSGGIVLDIETRLEISEPELQKGIMNTGSDPSTSKEATADLLEGIEYYENRLKLSGDLGDHIETKSGEEKTDELKQSKGATRAATYMSRWKAIVQSFADHVSQVPLSLAIRVTSLRGTLRLQIKPPPSDQLWFGFISMPEIDWNLDSSVGDRKITSNQIAVLIGNRFKASIREALVLPNCESICIPFMLAEKDDWVPRRVAPFIWINHEATEVTGPDALNSQPGEAESKLDGNNGSKAGLTAISQSTVGTINNAADQVQEPAHGYNSEIPISQTDPMAPETCRVSFPNSAIEDLKEPLLGSDERQESRNQINEPLEASSLQLVTTLEENTAIPVEEDPKAKKIGRRARMIDLGKKMGEKLEEKRRHIEEKSRHIVEKMRENSRT